MTLRRNRATRALTSLGLAAVLTAALAGIVAAHHADVSAQIDCDGLVTFTSTAWNGPSNASRTNPDIGVWYSVDGGAFTELLNVAYFFGPDQVPKPFSFTDSIELPGATFVTIKVRAQANWGNGTSPGDSRQATAFAPTDCVEEPPPPPPATPTPTPTPTPTTTPVVTTPTSTPVVTSTPQAASTPRAGTLGGNPTLPNTSAEMSDQTGALLVAAGMVLLLGVTGLVRERRVRQRSR